MCFLAAGVSATTVSQRVGNARAAPAHAPRGFAASRAWISPACAHTTYIKIKTTTNTAAHRHMRTNWYINKYLTSACVRTKRRSGIHTHIHTQNAEWKQLAAGTEAARRLSRTVCVRRDACISRGVNHQVITRAPNKNKNNTNTKYRNKCVLCDFI